MVLDFRAALTPKPVNFTRRSEDFLKIAGRGALLQLPTFGFYRFWMNTDLRRHLWSHTSVDGDAFEYTGTPRELLFGFLFAAAILAPAYFGYFLLGLEAERYKAYASTPLIVLLYLFAQFALFRARKYRLSRTVWRGVSFSMTGSGFAYAWRAAAWGLLTLFTLGFALPWRAAALERFKMRRSCYGDHRGDFVSSANDLFQRAGWVWMTFFALVAANVMFSFLAGRVPAFAHYRALVPLLAFATICAAPFLFAFFKVEEWRWWAQGLRFGPTSLSCDLQSRGYIILFLQYLGIMFCVVVVGLIALGVTAAMSLHDILPHAKGEAAQKAFMAALTPLRLAPLAGIYIAVMLVLGLAQRFFMQFRIWNLIASSLTVHRLEEVAAIPVEVTGATGEGLADGLDFGF